MHDSISSLSYLLVIIADGPQPRERPFEAPPKSASHPARANPPGRDSATPIFHFFPCPENPENTANGSGKILESDSAQLRRFERVTIVVSGPYTNVGSNHPPSRVPSPGIPDMDRSPPPWRPPPSRPSRRPGRQRFP